MIRTVVADDHHLVRQGIMALLQQAGDIEVVGQARDGHEAVQAVHALIPDVLLIDIAMPRFNGILACERVQASGLPTRVVILSMYADDVLVRQALRRGATGYLLKSAITDELLLAVRAASRGELYLSPSISQSVDQKTLDPSLSESDRLAQLTPRERELLQLIAEGCTNRQAAQLMGISPKTADNHRTNLMSKLDVHDVATLVRVAVRYGLVFLDENPSSFL